VENANFLLLQDPFPKTMCNYELPFFARFIQQVVLGKSKIVFIYTFLRILRYLKKAKKKKTKNKKNKKKLSLKTTTV
jgi:hypothetical protein